MKFKYAFIAALLLFLSSLDIEAQRRGGGGGRAGGGGARINRGATASSIRSNQSVNRNVNRNRDIDRNINRDIDRDLDIDRDIDWDRDFDRWGHPVARGVAAGIAFGATVAMLPSDCTTVVVNGIAYNQCGSTWYQPYYAGTDVEYVVVSPPQD